jgi:HK97 gp10 family phage protein
MPVTVSISRKGDKKFRKGVKEMSGSFSGVKVGILSGAGLHPGSNDYEKYLRKKFKNPKFKLKEGQRPTIAQVAFWNEYGTRFMPARPFMRPTLRQNASKYAKILQKGIGSILRGKDTQATVLKALGAKVEADIKNYALRLRTPPNAELTKEIKGSSNPLVHTTNMINSIHHALLKRGA